MVTGSNSPYVDSRNIGKARVTIICDGSFYWAPEIQAPEAEWRAGMPEANEAGELKIDLNLAHVQLGDASILIDLGFSDPILQVPHGDSRLRRSPGVVAGLAAIGVGRDE